MVGTPFSKLLDPPCIVHSYNDRAAATKSVINTHSQHIYQWVCYLRLQQADIEAMWNVCGNLVYPPPSCYLICLTIYGLQHVWLCSNVTQLSNLTLSRTVKYSMV